MRLFLSDSFWDKLTQLPRGIQQRVVDFQRKFRDNSTSSSIHLEPITQFRDSSLRTARVNDDYRAVLGVMGGDNYMFLYVDKHDEAYRWAMNKKFEWNEPTQSCQIIPINIQEEAPAPATSLPEVHHEPLPFEGYTVEQLLAVGVPEDAVGRVQKLKDLDELDKAADINTGFLPQDAFENLFALIDGEDIEDVIAQINEGKAAEGADSLLSANNRRRFLELTDDEELARIIAGDMEKWQIFLHPSQQALVKADYTGTVKVSGSAGTGKTIAAIHRLSFLASQQGAKVLFTTYTKALSENLASLINKFGIEKSRYDLLNIDKVLKKIATDQGIISSATTILDYEGMNGEKSKALWKEVIDQEVTEFDEEFLYDEYLDVIVYNNNQNVAEYLRQSRVGRSKPLSRRQRMEVWKLKELYENLKRERNAVDRLELFNLAANKLKDVKEKPYTNIIVDEFQDFSNPELRFLRSLVNESRNDLFLTGDPYQRIYSTRKINFTKAGINVRGKRSRKLKVNYRTTEEIKRLAVSVVKGVCYDDLDGGEENNKGYISIVHGDKPVYKLVANSNEECETILGFIEECTNNGMRLNEICIAATKKSLYRDILDAVHRKGLPYQEIKSGKAVGNKDGVMFCTFHSLKGLEFRAMALVGVTEASLPSKEASLPNSEGMDVVERREALSQFRSLLYVAITRGRQAVLISGYGAKTNLLK